MVIWTQSMGGSSLKTALANGFEHNIKLYRPDFILLQKVEDPIPQCLSNYRRYDAFSTDKRVHTVIYYKQRGTPFNVISPLSGMTSGLMIALDCADYRIINLTGYFLSYEDFNTYDNFRNIFWEEFLEYLKSIKDVNDTFIAGDLNILGRRKDNGGKIVPPKDKQVYSKILGMGFSDIWRHKHLSSHQSTYAIHPERHQEGVRTTYCFVPQRLMKKISFAKILSPKYSSGVNHRPLVIDIKEN